MSDVDTAAEATTVPTLVFIDTETTSLRPDRRAWEIGLVVRQPGQRDREWSWFVVADDLDLGNADLGSLKIGRYYDRHPNITGDYETCPVHGEEEILVDVEQLTRGATLVGAVPNFDADVLGTRMRAHGILPSWHYHLVDVETLAAGALKMPPPWSFDKVLAAYGLTYDEAERHTALGDARMARDLYDAVLAGKGDTT